MRKSIFFTNLKTSIKSPPGGAGEYNLNNVHILDLRSITYVSYKKSAGIIKHLLNIH